MGRNKKLSLAVASPGQQKFVEMRRKMTDTKKPHQFEDKKDYQKIKQQLFKKEKLMKTKVDFLNDLILIQYNQLMERLHQRTKEHEMGRLKVISRLQNVIQDNMDRMYTLKPYGSFESKLLTPNSDLDVSI